MRGSARAHVRACRAKRRLRFVRCTSSALAAERPEAPTDHYWEPKNNKTIEGGSASSAAHASASWTQSSTRAWPVPSVNRDMRAAEDKCGDVGLIVNRPPISKLRNRVAISSRGAKMSSSRRDSNECSQMHSRWSTAKASRLTRRNR
eukprot:6551244-Prymnesium_polylepis.4